MDTDGVTRWVRVRARVTVYAGQPTVQNNHVLCRHTSHRVAAAGQRAAAAVHDYLLDDQL